MNPSPYRQHMIAASMVPHNAVVLDVGCGAGQLGQYLIQTKNAVLAGVDADPESVNEALIRGYTHCYAVDLDELCIQHVFKGCHFDTIIFADILEHLKSPDALLHRATSLLRDGGNVVISIPNFQWYKVRAKVALGHFDYEEYGPLDRTHMRFFSLKSARDLIEGCGLDIIDVQYSVKPANILMARVARVAPSWFAYQMVFNCKKVSDV